MTMKLNWWGEIAKGDKFVIIVGGLIYIGCALLLVLFVIEKVQTY